MDMCMKSLVAKSAAAALHMPWVAQGITALFLVLLHKLCDDPWTVSPLTFPNARSA